MGVCSKGALLLFIAVSFMQLVKGIPVKRLWSEEQLKRNFKSSFKFINDTEIAKGLDYLKRAYPNVDWSLVTPLPTLAGKREYEQTNSLEEPKRSFKSSFKFINDTEIAKGLDYLKKAYPNVDWSLVTPLPTLAGKREYEQTNSLEEPKRSFKSSFKFINDTEIAKGLDYLKKAYPNVDWSLVTPLPTLAGKREFKSRELESGTMKLNNINENIVSEEKKSVQDDDSMQQREDIAGKFHENKVTSDENVNDDSIFEFLEAEDELKEEYLKEKYPHVDWTARI